MDKKPVFTIDLECWDSFRSWERWENVSLIEEPTLYLLDLLRRHQIKAIWYVVGWLADQHLDLINLINANNHIIGDHSYFHNADGPSERVWFQPGKKLFRSPRWKGEKRLYSGGFWLRAMPYWWIKRTVLNEKVFYIHPHDLLFEHPECGNPLKTFERRLGLKTSRDKLERLCRELEWDDPSKR